MIGSCCDTTPKAALLNESTLTWASTGSGKADEYLEEGWTLLPSGQLLTVDAQPPANFPNNSELYTPGPQTWTSPSGGNPNMPQLYGTGPGVPEVGPAVLLPSGNVFATGANPDVGTPANTAIYNPSSTTQKWTAGPVFPNVSINGHPISAGAGDAPAVLLPDGNVLISAGTALNSSTSFMFEYTGGSSLCQLNNVPSAIANAVNHEERMLVLPTGQVLVTLGTNIVNQLPDPVYFIYTPAASQTNPNWQPSIKSVSSSLTRGSTNNPISGTLFNGMSQTNMYGDDYQAATNYPLVQLTDSQGHIYYARTHDHSSMGVATGNATVSTQFDMPAASSGIATGPGTILVIANGIASTGVSVTIN
jgi:hypothetical protein